MTAPPVLPAKPPAASSGSSQGLWTRPTVLLAAVLGSAALVGLALLWRYPPQGQIFFPRCTFHQLTGLQCPGCGGLRATHALLHGNWIAAWQFNPLLVASLPVAAWTALALVIERRTGLRLPSPLAFRHLWIVLLMVILGFSIFRNL